MLSYRTTFLTSKPLAGLGGIWNRYLQTMLTWNRRDSTPLSAAPRARGEIWTKLCERRNNTKNYQDEDKKSAINKKKKLILRLRSLISKWFQLKTIIFFLLGAVLQYLLVIHFIASYYILKGSLATVLW